MITLEGPAEAIAWRLGTLVSLPNVSSLVIWRAPLAEGDLPGLEDAVREKLVADSAGGGAALAVIDRQGRLAGRFELEWPASDADGSKVIVFGVGTAVVSSDDESPGALIAAHVVLNMGAGDEYHPGTVFSRFDWAGHGFKASRAEIATVAAIPGVRRILFTNRAVPPYLSRSVGMSIWWGYGFAGESVDLHARVFTGYWHDVGWFPARRGDAWERPADYLDVVVQ